MYQFNIIIYLFIYFFWVSFEYYVEVLITIFVRSHVKGQEILTNGSPQANTCSRLRFILLELPSLAKNVHLTATSKYSKICYI